MQQKTFLIITGIILIVAAFYTFFEVNSDQSNIPTTTIATTSAPPVTTTTPENCIPTFADGGGPYYKPDSPLRSKISPEIHNGEKLIVNGKILQKDCKTPVANAVLDIWQANESGNYHDEWYRGRIASDNEGNYTFETVIPKGYGEGTGYRPPHIHFKVFMNNKEIITSQIFFPEVRGTPGFEDAYIMKLESKTENGNRIHNGNHNIILSI